jgi:hypothetical protein
VTDDAAAQRGQAVIRGQALLHDYSPGWWGGYGPCPVNASLLLSGDPDCGVICQLHAHLPDPWRDGLAALGLSGDDAAEYGFAGSTDTERRQLGKLWHLLVTSLRCEALLPLPRI